jgi:hypothetical protein
VEGSSSLLGVTESLELVRPFHQLKRTCCPILTMVISFPRYFQDIYYIPFSWYTSAYYLPQWVAGSHYVELLKQHEMVDVRMDDWSEYVKPFWPAVIKTALYPWNIMRLLKGGTLMMKAAYASVS